MKWLGIFFSLFFASQFFTGQAYAAPYFYLEGQNKIYPQNNWRFVLKLNTDGGTVTAAQAVVEFDEAIIKQVAINNTFSKCSFWAPPDPSLGFGNNASPYFLSNNKLIVSCGFSNPGYTTSSSGDQILAFTLTTADSLASPKSTNLRITNTKFYYIQNELTPGSSPTFNLTAYESTSSAVYLSPTPTPIVVPDTLTEGELEFVNITDGTGTSGQSNQSATGSQAGTALDGSPINAIARDDTIPAPPDNLPQRSPASPYPTPPPPKDTDEVGEVLSIRSLRELLIPGESDADKSVVLINLISFLTFLVILAILIWRLLLITRMNKLRSKHMKDLLTGELSVLETKIAGDKKIDEKEFNESIEKLKEDLDKV